MPGTEDRRPANGEQLEIIYAATGTCLFLPLHANLVSATYVRTLRSRFPRRTIPTSIALALPPCGEAELLANRAHEIAKQCFLAGGNADSR